MPVTSSSPERSARRLARRVGVFLLALLHAGLLALLVFIVRRGSSELLPGGGPGGLPSGPPIVIGAIARLDGDAFVASAYAEEREVRVDAHTVVVRRDGPASFEALRPGRGVIVWGVAGPDRVVHARTILVGPVP